VVGAVIFDWDGTLARSLDLWVEGYVQAFVRRHTNGPFN
jgi:beta-phosphoglucomutase-like phosphatase (HAD superfamily)